MTADAAQPASVEQERPAGLRDRVFEALATRLPISIGLVLLVLAGLPVAVWADLRSLSERTLVEQAGELARMVDGIRGYYATNVVERVLAATAEGEPTKILPNYHDVPGAIPIPATLALELADVISRDDGNVGFRFFSDLPFKNRPPHVFDQFERNALAQLRATPRTQVWEVSGSIFDRRVRLATPIIMSEACVSCHNSHPDSPKHDWQVGDVRGIEEFTIFQPIARNIFAFKYLLIYFVVVAVIGLAFIGMQRHQSRLVQRFNRQLGQANAFLAVVASKIGKYLPPQLYRGILSGQRDVEIATERKQLTIFFSDVVGFTASTERLPPEELTRLLNEYLTEMSEIAHHHGGTVNKFIGDAILVFFGDPDTHGVVEDAKACVAMAFDMQRRLGELNTKWRRQGITEPFQARIGINSGYCNIGNFGSSDRMDYTIIGAEANLAARLQAVAEPGGIVISHETFILVRDEVRARPLEPITLKGIGRPIVPYVVEGRAGEAMAESHVISEHGTGLELFLDTRAVDVASAGRLLGVLESAVSALKAKAQPAGE